MLDRLLARSLNFAVLGLIVSSAVGALLLCYRGLFRVVSKRPEEGVVVIALGVGLAIVCLMLCRHRHELADS